MGLISNQVKLKDILRNHSCYDVCMCMCEIEKDRDIEVYYVHLGWHLVAKFHYDYQYLHEKHEITNYDKKSTPIIMNQMKLEKIIEPEYVI